MAFTLYIVSAISFAMSSQPAQSVEHRLETEVPVLFWQSKWSSWKHLERA